MPDGRFSGSEPVQVHDLRPPEIPRQRGGADDKPTYPSEPAHLVPAQDRPDQALGLLEHLHALAIARAGMGNLIEIQALRALALAAGGDHTAAVAALAEALTLANHRVFADEGAPMTVLLGRPLATQRTEQTAARGVPLDDLAGLLPVFGTTDGEPHPAKGAVAAMPVMIDPLTARERQVLALLAAGRSNRRIAAELYVTLDTVKKHVGHILDKLGAANRTEAAARARQLGLIG